MTETYYTKEHEWVKVKDGDRHASALPITRPTSWGTSPSWSFRRSGRA